jgi:hypothetical protein
LRFRKAGLIILFTIMMCISLSAQKQSAYISLINSREINVPEENYISALDAGTYFETGTYIHIGAGINVTKIWSVDYSSGCFGVGPELQFYFLRRPRIKLFLEGKGRVMYLFPEYPDTELNFAFLGGPNAEFYVNEVNRLKFGICYNHLSNGKPVEQYKNQSLDGLGFSIGWVFY